MSSVGWNPHKKGEHVFNDIAGSVVNAFARAIAIGRANSLLLTGPYGPLSKRDLPISFGWVNNISVDEILILGRTLVAPPSGIQDDANSRTYGKARTDLELALSQIVEATASLTCKRRPHPNSSFKDLDPLSQGIISGFKDVQSSVMQARIAFHKLVQSAHDQQAEAALLSEKVSTTELMRRHAILEATKQHLPNVIATGQTLVGRFSEELEPVLDARIGKL
jgi:hypothetical protein